MNELIDSYDFASGYKPPAEPYKAKGRFKVNITYKFYDTLNGSRWYNDTRHYDTDKEKSQYIDQSINAVSKLAYKYGTRIYSLNIDNKIYTPSRIMQGLSNL